MPRRKYHNSTSFLDLLFNTLLGFVMLFFFASLMVRSEEKKANLETKAEFVVVVTWPDDSSDDVDTWLEDPLGNVLYFRQREVGMSHLDRDDLGKLHDIIRLNDGRVVEYTHNQELTTIRGFIGGEWVLNVHMYNKRDEAPTAVEVRVEKLNPTVKTVLYKTVVMSQRWEEVTVSRFMMTAAGEIVSWDDLPKGLVESHLLQP